MEVWQGREMKLEVQLPGEQRIKSWEANSLPAVLVQRVHAISVVR